MDASSKSQWRDGSGVFRRTSNAVRRYTAYKVTKIFTFGVMTMGAIQYYTGSPGMEEGGAHRK